MCDINFVTFEQFIFIHRMLNKIIFVKTKKKVVLKIVKELAIKMSYSDTE